MSQANTNEQASIVSNGEARGIPEKTYRLILQYASSYAEQVELNPDLFEDDSLEDARQVQVGLNELRRE